MTFQSLRSSSSGNCVRLTCDGVTILIDCGFKSQRECRAALAAHRGEICGVLVSHAHGDHVCYPALRALTDHGTRVHCHIDVLPHVQRSHAAGPKPVQAITPFGALPFVLGPFDIQPVAVPHAPGCPTFGFAVRCGKKKVVVCTDFHSAAAISEHLVDADFVFIESNHDVELLRRFPNWGSHYHMSNDKTATVLSSARQKRTAGFSGVMLGHLSEQRNDADLALQTIRDHFGRAGVPLDFDLTVAPRLAGSAVVAVN